jgi:hypothetical protein
MTEPVMGPAAARPLASEQAIARQAKHGTPGPEAAGGVASEAVPPVATSEVGDIQNQPTRSQREYPAAGQPSLLERGQAGGLNVGVTDPTIAAAIIPTARNCDSLGIPKSAKL